MAKKKESSDQGLVEKNRANSVAKTKSVVSGSGKSAGGPMSQLIVEDDRTGMSEEAFTRAFLDNLFYIQGVNLKLASSYDHYMALSYTVRDRLMHRWLASVDQIFSGRSKVVCYLSAEFLMGRQLANNLLNIGCFQQVRHALNQHGISIHDVIEAEPEPGLGNGGLGRLAACFLDSLATLSVPAVGYGIRYEYGIFKQAISDGWQVEQADDWLKFGNPWEVVRPERTAIVGFGGHVEPERKSDGTMGRAWKPSHFVLGTPHDTLVPGFGTDMVNTLRLWRAHANSDFDFQIFNAGDYYKAVADKMSSENISKVLYPNDWTPQGRELRLKQQYFFVSSSLQNIFAILKLANRPLEELPEGIAIQMNDTHPAIAVAELMRLLLDKYELPWQRAWDLTTKTLGFTNHTLMSEALERWPVSMFENMLPRHLEIIYEINSKFLVEVATKFPGDLDRINRMSIIEEGEDKKVRMANLATVGSHAVNGVAKLHSDLVKSDLLPDFYQLWPQKFSNKTNGITPRRWLMLSNPKLSYLITETIGKGWLKDLDALRELEKSADDSNFLERWNEFQQESKVEFAQHVKSSMGLVISPEAIFDVQVKRLHEYKRQLLNVLHVITRYHEILAGVRTDAPGRVCIFGGKAAPGYFQAKLIIKLINSVAEVVNNDPRVKDQLKVLFVPNFSVSLGEKIYPAADLSEQISTAGTEASGTGNMKFSLNGALTIGTLDGANIEIRDAVGAENFFLFGNTVEQLREISARRYRPYEYVERDARLQGVIGALSDGTFARGNRELYRVLVDELLTSDRYFLMADYASYIEAQAAVDKTFAAKAEWQRKSILNVARMGYFSSDRTIKEYCDEIWGAKPVRVELGSKGEEVHHRI